MTITINVAGMDTLRKALADMEVSPALKQAMSETARLSCGVMAGGIARIVAASAGSCYIAEMHQRLADKERRRVTEAMLAELGVKRLAGD